MRQAALWVILSGVAYGQTPDKSPAFEVATIKPSAGPQAISAGAVRTGCWGGPGTADPGRYTCVDSSVPMLVRSAFNLKNYQMDSATLSDGPKWTIAAKIPAGATMQQVRLMLQNLLKERFKLVYHFEKREMQAYELVVGKNGSKLTPAGPAAPTAPQIVSPENRAADGMPSVVRGGVAFYIASNGDKRMSARDVSIEQIAAALAGELGKPVTDATGLSGKFDFAVSFHSPDQGGFAGPSAAASVNGGAGGQMESNLPTLFTAVQEQLGLKLEPKKGTIDFLVIDGAAKTPTGN